MKSSAALWTSADAVTATGGRTIAKWKASGVSIDTRTIQPGDLFVALKDVRDGHDFVAQALKKGAAAALVSHIPEGVTADAPLLIVDDVLQALEKLGIFARARTGAKVVGVTGSVGKTSTKEMLRRILAGQGSVHAAEASYNNHWGVPLTLARMPPDSDFAVIEIGMSHPGEIAPLARMADLDIALITIVAAAHLEAFSDLEGIAHEKASIFDGLRPRRHRDFPRRSRHHPDPASQSHRSRGQSYHLWQQRYRRLPPRPSHPLRHRHHRASHPHGQPEPVQSPVARPPFRGQRPRCFGRS